MNEKFGSGAPSKKSRRKSVAKKATDGRVGARKNSLQQETSKLSAQRARSEKQSEKPGAPEHVAPVAPIASEQKLEWIELFPQGISVGSTVGRPVLILKDKHGVEVLPVWMSPLDAGVALADLSHGSVGSSPHSLARRILEALDVVIESCVFDELVGHHQFVQVNFKGNPRLKCLRLRADEAMSFCLQARARFYSTRPYMARCRDMDADLASFEHSLAEGVLPALETEMEIGSKKHPYMM